MKKIILAATALSLMAAPAFAATTPPTAPPQTNTITLTGSVAPACSTLAQTGTVALDAISTGVGVLKRDAIERSLGGPIDFTCNGAKTTVSVDADPLENKTVVSIDEKAATEGFTRIVNYTATITLTGYNSGGITTIANGTGDTSPTSRQIGLAKGAGSIALSNASIGTSTNLVAGNYEGKVVVVLTPTA